MMIFSWFRLKLLFCILIVCIFSSFGKVKVKKQRVKLKPRLNARQMISARDAVKICFNPGNPEVKEYLVHQPPEKIPDAFDDRIFSISAEMHITRTVVAFICYDDDANRTINEEHYLYSQQHKENRTRYFKVSTVSKNVYNEYDGQLCHTTHDSVSSIVDVAWLDSHVQMTECGKPGVYGQPGVPAGLDEMIPVRGNMLIVQGLMHTKPSLDYRMFKFELFETAESGKPIAVANSNEISVDSPVRYLRWLNSSFSNIVANRPFNISLEICGYHGEVITSGFGSTLSVLVTLSYTHKVFYKTGRKSNILYSSKATLAGKEVKTSKRNNDKILQKRAIAGQVHFSDVRILDATGVTTLQLRLNATLLIPRGVWRRVPNDYSDLKCIQELSAREVIPVRSHSFASPVYVEGHNVIPEYDRNQLFYTHDVNCKITSKAVLLSDEFTVGDQKAEIFILKENYGRVKNFTFNANFMIDGISYEVQDYLGNRIYTGADSDLDIIVFSDPKDIQVHYTTKCHVRSGAGVFYGSVVETVDAVKLCFTVKTIDGEGKDKLLKETCTRTFKIIGNINMAVFGLLKSTGDLPYPDPLTNLLARFAVEDINNRLGSSTLEGILPVLPKDRTMSIASYNTKLNIYTTDSKYKRMILKAMEEPARKVGGLIGFMERSLTLEMYPLIIRDGLICFSVRAKKYIGQMSTTFIRLAYSESSFYAVFCSFLATRSWLNIIMIRSENSDLDGELFTRLRRCGVQFGTDINLFTPHEKMSGMPEESFDYSKLELVKNAGTKIIFCHLRIPTVFLVLRKAIELKVTPLDGYQWIFALTPAMAALESDRQSICHQNGVPICGDAFAGSLFLFPQNELNYESVLWQHVHQKLFQIDRTIYLGLPGAYPVYFASQFAYGYDAVLLYAQTIAKYIQKNKTFIPEDIVHDILADKFHGLTGEIEYEQEFRKGFAFDLLSTRANSLNRTKHFTRGQICKHLSFINIDKKELLVEVLHQSDIDTWQDGAHELGIMTLPVTNFTQKYRFYSRVGIISRSSSTLIIPPDVSKVNQLYPIVEILGVKNNTFSRSDLLRDPNTIVIREETVVMSYYCISGCGGKILSELNKNDYENGICVGHGKCRCKTLREIRPDAPKQYWTNKAFRGRSCTVAQCEKCVKGICIGPEICLCIAGYKGLFCNEAICEKGCGIGECILPNVCRCIGGYLIGPHCNIFIIVLVAPLFCLFFLCGCCLMKLIYEWQKKSAWELSLKMKNWLVDWEDVTMFEETLYKLQTKTRRSTVKKSISALMTYGPSVSLSNNVRSKLAYWRNQECYIQTLNIESVDITDLKILAEITDLNRAVHPNLVYFVGISVKDPRIGLFVDFYPKGSMKEILRSQTFPLDWDIKFALLKDIARGMDFLHNSNIGSHGQLKSSCCLLDNRWAVRVGGFGIPSIRKACEEIESPQDLLWTAPELLRVHDTMREIIPGTKAGDVYSFAIIISEMCTEKEPYAEERNILTIEEIIILLKNCNAPANRALRSALWANGIENPSDVLRPFVHPNAMPIETEEMIGLTKLMKNCWDENSTKRMTFLEILSKLGKIKVVKGDLLESLIKRLEVYSVKLEANFVEASQLLGDEKVKLEEMIGLLLPKTIVDRMIQGTIIPAEAEYFENVTVCISDIYDFVSITRQMTPYEIINLLNGLYVCFDSIIGNFDAYIVDTVRDEYMIASGLPERNGHNHVIQVAHLALYLMASIVTFEAQYTPLNEMLKLRIGIHSGPCIAGVVGLKRPRYSLFGDTIGIATLMKESSNAFQIQMSESTVKIMKKIGGFQFDYRTEIKFKKNMVKTYWLTGADDFSKPLPIARKMTNIKI